MGSLYARFSDYGIGLGLLAAVAASAAVFTLTAVRRPAVVQG